MLPPEPAEDGPDRIELVTESLPDGDVDVQYSSSLAAIGGDGQYVWRITQGELPAGLVLDSLDGTIEGVPSRPETVDFTVVTSDAAGSLPGRRELSIQVYPRAVVLGVAPGGVVGDAYGAQLQAEGGRGGYEWSIVDGTLPPGLQLQLSGSIAGTPTEAGRWSFLVRLRSGPVMVDTSMVISICASGGVTNWSGVAPWRGYQRDGAHTGYVPVSLEPCRFVEAWSAAIGTGGYIPSQVVTEDGIAYVTTQASWSARTTAVVALELATGAELWRFEAERLGHPGVQDGTVYATAGWLDESELIAIDARSGDPRFRTRFLNQDGVYRAPIVSQGLVLAGATMFGGVQAYDASTGDSVWAAGTMSSPYPWAVPAVTDTTVHAINTYGLASLQTFDLATGAELMNTGGTCNCIGGFTPTLTAPDRAVATIVRDLTSFDLSGDSLVWVRSATDGRSRTVATAHGSVFTMADGAVEVIDESNGNLVRSWTPQDQPLEGPAGMLVTDNLLFLVFGGRVHAVDLSTWEEVWHHPIAGELSLSEGVLFIHAADGTVVAVSVG